MFLRSMNKLARQLALLCLFFCATAADGRVFRPIQIFFPGNMAGRAVSLSESHEPMPAACWKAPSLIATFKRYNSDKINLVFATGNDSSIYLPASFLDDGDCERAIIERCRPEGAAVSPDDLLMFRNRLLSSEIRRRILTNLESENELTVFQPYKTQVHDKTRFWFFNFIGEEQFKLLPMQRWSQVKPENPARAMRRLDLQFDDSDISISLVYTDRNEAEELIAHLQKQPGTHIVMQVVTEERAAFFSQIDPQQRGNTFVFSCEEGWKRLPMLKIARRNQGRPRLTLRLLPYEKAETGDAMRDFAACRPTLIEKLHKTLALITTSIRPSTAPFRFKPDISARFARSTLNTDVALVAIPAEAHKIDNVISAVSLVSSFPNDRIRTARIGGRELLQLVTDILRATPQPFPGMAGLSCEFFADTLKNPTIEGFAVDPHKHYHLAISENLQVNPVGKPWPGLVLEPFEGTTLWDVWKNQIKSLRITQEHLR